MNKTINFSIAAVCLIAAYNSFAFNIKIVNDSNDVHIPYIESLSGLAPDNIGGWILPKTERIYDNDNTWLNATSIEVKEGDVREVKMGDASCGKIKFSGDKTLTFYQRSNFLECRVLDTASLKSVYIAEAGQTCENGRVLTEQEFNSFQIEMPNLCQNTGIWGDDSIIGTKKYDGSIHYLVTGKGPSNTCRTLANVCNQAPYKCTDLAEEDNLFNKTKLLCISNPHGNQVFAYSDTSFNNGGPVTGDPKVGVNYDDLAGEKIYNGSFLSFKVGDSVEIRAFTETNLGGNETIIKSGVFSSRQQFKSFIVKYKEINSSDVFSNDEYKSIKMKAEATPDVSTSTCSINVESILQMGVMNNKFEVTVTAFDQHDEPYATERARLWMGYSQIPENGVLVNHASGDRRVTFQVDGKQLTRCLITKFDISGMGRAKLEFSKNNHEIIASWYDIAENNVAIDNPHHAAQLLSEPVMQRLIGHSRSNYGGITRAYNRSEQYQNLRQNIIDGSTGIARGYYGFSVDFLELKTREDINDFLLETVINPAYLLGVISEGLNDTDFAEELRRELMAEMSQDAQYPYGSFKHVNRSIAMMFSGVIPNHWQRNQLINSVNISIDSLQNIHLPYMNKSLPPMFGNSAFSSDDKDEDKITPVHILANLTFSSDDEQTRKEAYLNLFAKNTDIRVDYDKGLITNISRQGGYLGRDFLKIASDLYGVETKDLSSEMKTMTKTALDSLGIDTIYSYGSLRGIKSSVLHRLISRAQSPAELIAHLHLGGAPEMLDVLKEKMADKGAATDKLQQTILYDAFAYSGLSVPESSKNQLWDTLSQIEQYSDEVSKLEGIIKREKDGSPMFGIAFSDEQFTKSIFYRCGIEESIIEKGWERYHNQSLAPPLLLMLGPPTAPPFLPAPFPEDQQNCHNDIMNEFKAKYGGYYTPSQLWNLHFKEIAKPLGRYAGSFLDMNAKLLGKSAWQESSLKKNNTRFFGGYIEEYTEIDHGSSSPFYKRTRKIAADKWVIANDALSYSIKTEPDTLGLMYLNDLEFIPAVSSDLSNSRSTLWDILNPKAAVNCGTESAQSSRNEWWYRCFVDSETYKTYSDVNKVELSLGLSLNQFFLANQEEFRVAKFKEDEFWAFLKSFLPFLASIEAIHSGETEGLILHLISDLMMFVPAAGALDDVLIDGITAIRPSLFKPGVKIKGSPMSVKHSKNMTIGGKPNKQEYKKESVHTVSKLHPNSLVEIDFNGGINGLPPRGKPSGLSNNKPQRKPDNGELGAEATASKYHGDKKKLKNNGDGTYTGDDGKKYLKDGDDFHHAEQDENGDWFLLDKDGKRTQPVKKDQDGKLVSNDLLELTANEAILAGAQRVFVNRGDKLRKMGSGLIIVNNKHKVVKIEDHYFKAEYDPVYKVLYIYNLKWDRTPLMGPVKKKWFKNSKKAKYCTFVKAA